MAKAQNTNNIWKFDTKISFLIDFTVKSDKGQKCSINMHLKFKASSSGYRS